MWFGTINHPCMDCVPLDVSTRLPAYPDGGAEEVSRLVEALSTYRQRCVLYHLMETEPADLEEVTREVAAMEQGQLPEEVPSEIHGDVQVDLYHNILPKLTELKIIEYDPRSKTLSYRHPPKHIEEFLELTQDLDPV